MHLSKTIYGITTEWFRRIPFTLIFFAFFLFSCSDSSNKEEKALETEEKAPEFVEAPGFNQDSAFQFVARQVAFGPRVPNTSSHQEAGEYFIEKFKSYGAKVITQDFSTVTFDKTDVQLRNIIASFYPDNTKRILLAAHWDSRPFADKDVERKNEPIAGANDGASGVAVLMEIARVLHNQKDNPPDVGVDIILFDGEDWGNDSSTQEYVPVSGDVDSWWCLGSQYWAKHPHKPRYTAYYGILLDMVGGSNATFYREGFSMNFPKIVAKVWQTANRIGHGDHFIPVTKGSITDDHYFVNKYTNIPMVDIIPHDQHSDSFGDFHHTHKDNMEIISPETLDAVGETLLTVIYNEN